MGSTAVAAHEYWGYLIKPDKNPTAVFEQLLYGIANYIVYLPLALHFDQDSGAGTKADSYYFAETPSRAMGYELSYAREARYLLSSCWRRLRSSLPRDFASLPSLYLPIPWLLPHPTA